MRKLIFVEVWEVGSQIRILHTLERSQISIVTYFGVELLDRELNKIMLQDNRTYLVVFWNPKSFNLSVSEQLLTMSEDIT